MSSILSHRISRLSQRAESWDTTSMATLAGSYPDLSVRVFSQMLEGISDLDQVDFENTLRTIGYTTEVEGDLWTNLVAQLVRAGAPVYTIFQGAAVYYRDDRLTHIMTNFRDEMWADRETLWRWFSDTPCVCLGALKLLYTDGEFLPPGWEDDYIDQLYVHFEYEWEHDLSDAWVWIHETVLGVECPPEPTFG